MKKETVNQWANMNNSFNLIKKRLWFDAFNPANTCKY